MADEQHDRDLERLLEYLRDERGFDFTGYKRASLARRLAKRMQAVEVDDYAVYQDFLQVHPGELEELFDAILINVTGFFRDPAAWQTLEGQIVPEILQAKQGDEAIRVWCAAVASGEESYSIAMVLADALGDEQFRARVKIYATDVDEDALTVARAASYQRRRVEGVPEERLERFFDAVNGRYVFRSDLRRSVIFGRHDLVQDAPISRVDLLICRNVLMYFNASTQSGILQSFQFALAPEGYLFLGKSEVLLSRTSAFAPVDLRARIFRKHAGDVAAPGTVIDVPPRVLPATLDGELLPLTFEREPLAHLVVDAQARLVHANERARALFGLVTGDIGRPLQDLELSYRPIELRSRIQESSAESRVVTVREVEWVGDDGSRWFDVQVIPLARPSGDRAGISIVFTDVSRPRGLQDELQSSKRELQTAYEELQSTVEELETTNEELQSTNEELETMNEELQSTNEELEAVNDEFRERTQQLNHLNSFLEHILTSLRAAVVVLDRDLRVDVWNSRAADLWGLRSDEVRGEHLLGLDIGLPVEQLKGPLRACLAGETELQELRLAARNRRGRQITCIVSVTPLQGGGEAASGVILLMEEAEVGSG